MWPSGARAWTICWHWTNEDYQAPGAPRRELFCASECGKSFTSGRKTDIINQYDTCRNACGGTRQDRVRALCAEIEGEYTEMKKRQGFRFGLFLVTIGIVYGDIGTSPMYVMKSILEGNGGIAHVDESFIVGSYSSLMDHKKCYFSCLFLGITHQITGDLILTYASWVHITFSLFLSYKANHNFGQINKEMDS